MDIIILGVIGASEASIVSAASPTLHAFHVPLIITSPEATEVVTQSGNTLTTAPDMTSQIQVTKHHLRCIPSSCYALMQSEDAPTTAPNVF